MANTSLQVAELDFDTLRESLKNFLRNRDELSDYDFDTSTIGLILDILAYNTYHQSFYLNMVGNESFLSTAIKRENVVDRAKEHDYTPRSAHGATVFLNVTINPNDDPLSIEIPKNERFTTEIDDVTYTFVTPRSQTVVANSTGGFRANVEIVEGEPLTHRFTVNSDNPQRFIIPNDRVDTRSIIVKVRQSSEETANATYKKATTLTDVTGNSEVFFLQEVEDGRFEVTFGDDVLGKSVSDGNIILVDYRVCNEDVPNGADNFTPPSTLAGYSDFTINSIVKAAGGDKPESIESIKFNAPKSSQAQDRVVTKNDYKTMIRNNFGDIQSISVWGGEESNPPFFGRAFISMKPKTGNLLSESRKEQIKDFLLERSVLSIEPFVVDPTFLFIVTSSVVKYNSDRTELDPSDIIREVKNAVNQFEENNLGQFDENFIHSDFVAALKAAHSSVTSVQTSVALRKKITPITGARRTYSVPFNHQVLNIGYRDTVTSSEFTFQRRPNCKLDVDSQGRIRVYFIRSGSRTYVSRNVGTIDFNTGLLTLRDVNVQSFKDNNLRIDVIPAALDVSPIRNQILLLENARIDVFDTNVESTVASTTVITLGGQTDLGETGILNTVF